MKKTLQVCVIGKVTILPCRRYRLDEIANVDHIADNPIFKTNIQIVTKYFDYPASRFLIFDSRQKRKQARIHYYNCVY